LIAEKVRAVEAAVALAALGVEDPELRPPARRPEPVAGDRHVRSLADDVAPEPDPCSARELEAKAGRFGDGGLEPPQEARWLEGDEERFRPTSERGETAQPFGDAGRGRAGVRTRRKVDDEQVDRSTGEESAGDRQAFVERLGRQDDEPIQADAAGDCLDRIEAPGEIQPGDDRAVDLGLGSDPQGEGRLARARLATQGDARAAGQPARAEDRIQLRKARVDDPLDHVRGRLAGNGVRLRLLIRQRGRRERADDPRSCGAPACLEGRQSSRHVRRERRHGGMIEQMF
jgi:hypothetical protein